MVAYTIMNGDVHDAEGYAKYVEITTPTVAKFGGKFIARGANAVVKEGTPMSRTVIVEWPDVATAEAFYSSPEYEEALSHGLPASTRNYWVVDGA
ncbi:MAG: DUF1330 domain-containing protein [Pseudomonadota bacterium]